MQLAYTIKILQNIGSREENLNYLNLTLRHKA